MRWMILAIAVTITGCSSITDKKYAVITTQSGIGLSIGIKETNMTPDIRLGYVRSELVCIPTTGDKVASVIARLNYKSTWQTEGGISSVVATGEAATNQSLEAIVGRPVTILKGNGEQ